MIAKVLQLKQNNEPEKAEQELDEFGNDYLKINLNELIENNNPSIIDELITQHSFELTHFKILEELLYQKYLLAKENEKLKTVTLNISQYVAKNDTDFSLERNSRIKVLRV